MYKNTSVAKSQMVPSQSKSKEKRSREKPEWFGKRASMSQSSDSANEGELFSDDSMDDKNYTPEKKKQKKSTNIAQNSIEFEQIDLNIEFNRLTRNESEGKECEHGESRKSNLANSIQDKREERNNVENTVPEIDNKLLQNLYKNSVEILERISVIEDSLMKQGVLKVVKNEKNSKSVDHFESFMTSNNLPLKCIDHMDTFELSLKDDTFKNIAVWNLHLLCIFIINF